MPLESFIKAGITFSVKDDILIKGSGNDLPYIAKLLAIDSKSKIEGEDGYTYVRRNHCCLKWRNPLYLLECRRSSHISSRETLQL